MTSVAEQMRGKKDPGRLESGVQQLLSGLGLFEVEDADHPPMPEGGALNLQKQAVEAEQVAEEVAGAPVAYFPQSKEVDKLLEKGDDGRFYVRGGGYFCVSKTPDNREGATVHGVGIRNPMKYLRNGMYIWVVSKDGKLLAKKEPISS